MIGTALTHRIPTERDMIGAVRCALRLHFWARWELGVATYLKPKREVPVQLRECIDCGLLQIKHL